MAISIPANSDATPKRVTIILPMAPPFDTLKSEILQNARLLGCIAGSDYGFAFDVAIPRQPVDLDIVDRDGLDSDHTSRMSWMAGCP